MSEAPSPVPDTQSITPWLEDKGLWMALLGVVLPFISKFVGIQLDPEKIAMFLIPIVAFILAHKAKSGAVLIAEIKARAEQAVAATNVSTAQETANAINSLMVPK